MTDAALADLAQRAGVLVHWTDAAGRDQVVSDEALRAVLGALSRPAGTAAEIAECLERLEADRGEIPPLVTADADGPVLLPAGVPAGRARLRFESGETRDVTVEHAGAASRIAGIDRPGYHALELGDREIAIAVAPATAFTLQDAAPGRRLWGAGVQL